VPPCSGTGPSLQALIAATRATPVVFLACWRQAASRASTLLRLRIGLQPIGPGLKIAPQQHACKRQKHDCHGYAHHHCVKRHIDLPALTGGIYPRREMLVFDPDQISKTAFRIALFATGLGRGQGLGARRIQQADASRQDFDHAITLELGKGTTDRFNGQPQEIRDILAAHRQSYRL
jgi:hypothetical protein